MSVLFLNIELGSMTSVSAKNELGDCSKLYLKLPLWTLCWLQLVQNMALRFVLTVAPGSCELCWYEHAVNKSWLPGVLCCQTLNVLSGIKNRFFFFSQLIEVVQPKLNCESSFQVFCSKSSCPFTVFGWNNSQLGICDYPLMFPFSLGTSRCEEGVIVCLGGGWDSSLGKYHNCRLDWQWLGAGLSLISAGLIWHI